MRRAANLNPLLQTVIVPRSSWYFSELRLQFVEGVGSRVKHKRTKLSPLFFKKPKKIKQPKIEAVETVDEPE